MTISATPLHDTPRLQLATLGVTETVANLRLSTDTLTAEIDRLANHVERLLKERALMIDVLSQFYRSDITISSLQPLMDLAVQLNPSLKEPR